VNKNWKDLNAYKASLKLSEIQKEIIIGSVLGDLSIRQIGKYSRLALVREHKEYLFHLYDIFKDFTRTPPKERVQKRLKTSEPKSTWYFSTISRRAPRLYRELFYPHGKKIFPVDVGDHLSARSLAYWYMDDGTYNKGYYSLSTANFTLEEHNLLVDCLDACFACKPTIQGTAYKNLYIPVKYGPRFKSLIEPNVAPPAVRDV